MSFANDKLYAFKTRYTVFSFDFSALFTVQPVSVVQAEGVDAVFECLYLGAVSHSWGINGTFPADNEFQPDFTRTQPSGDTPATLTIPATAHYNNTVVLCRALVEVEGGFVGRLTENTTLTIFGKSLIYMYVYILMPLTLCHNLLLQPLLLMQVMIRM